MDEEIGSMEPRMDWSKPQIMAILSASSSAFNTFSSWNESASPPGFIVVGWMDVKNALSSTFFFGSVSASSEKAKLEQSSTLLGHFKTTPFSSLAVSPSITSSFASTAPLSKAVTSSISSNSPAQLSSAHTLASSEEDLASLKAEPTTTYHNPSPIQQPPDKRLLRQAIKREGEFVCGWGAAFINICVTFPLNKAIFRQQLHGISGKRAIGQLHRDGLRYLYRGLLPPLLQKTASLSIMFGMYYRCQDILYDQMPTMNIFVNHTLAALASGAMEAVFTPFERVQAIMQTRQYHDKFANTLDAFASLRSYGLREYYRGLSLIILRNGPSNVAFFIGREQLQLQFIHCDSGWKKMMKDFLSGACLGAVISTFFFPINVVKTRLQCKVGGDFERILPTFKLVWEERNRSIRGLFRGVHLNYTRSFISWGIINASYEYLMKTFFIPYKKDDSFCS